jgi:hypothetical protein
MPEQAMRADLQDMDIEGVTEEDLAFFSNLCSVDLGENCVPLELLRTLPALQELRLHCNSVRDIGDLGVNGFAKLEVLDLSYNMLEVDAIGRLAALPRLRRLDLTCNQLQSLPLNMAAFGMLQALNLERNDLVDEDVLIGLAAIPHVRVWCTGGRGWGAGERRGGGMFLFRQVPCVVCVESYGTRRRGVSHASRAVGAKDESAIKMRLVWVRSPIASSGRV